MEYIVWPLFAWGLIITFWQIWRVEKVIQRSMHNTSRFPMFAARDRAVHLISDGQMSEDDTEWRTLYKSLNTFLNIENHWDLFRFAKTYMWVAVDSKKRPEYEIFAARMAAKESAVPEFGHVMSDFGRAMYLMISRRTSRTKLLILLLALGVARSLIGVAVIGKKTLGKLSDLQEITKSDHFDGERASFVLGKM